MCLTYKNRNRIQVRLLVETNNIFYRFICFLGCKSYKYKSKL